MIPYVLLYLIFLINAIFWTCHKETRVQIKVLFIIFFLFAGLRFETGNDWYVYQEYYRELLGSSWSFRLHQILNSEYEPLYVIYQLPFAAIGAPFQYVMLLTSGLNTVVLYKYYTNSKSPIGFSLLLYLGFVYLSGQMAMIRQSLSACLVIMGIIFYLKKRHAISITLTILSIGFQLSSIIFILPLALYKIKPSFRILFTLALIGIIGLFVIGHDPEIFIPLIKWLPPSFIGKFIAYIGISFSISASAYIYIFLNSIFLIYLVSSDGKSLDQVQYYILFWVLLLMLFCQTTLSFMPIFWNRVQMVSIVLQSSALVMMLKSAPPFKKLAVVAAIGIMSGYTYFKALSDPAAIAYIPYQVFPIGQEHSGENRFSQGLAEHLNRNSGTGEQ
jgi:hypothetical protein